MSNEMECAEGMGQSRRSNSAAVKDALINLSEEDSAGSTEQMSKPINAEAMVQKFSPKRWSAQ